MVNFTLPIAPVIRTGPVFCAAVTCGHERNRLRQNSAKKVSSVKILSVTYGALWSQLCCSAGTPCPFLPQRASLSEGAPCSCTQATSHASSTHRHWNTRPFIAPGHPTDWVANKLSRTSVKIFSTVKTKAHHQRRSRASSIHPPLMTFP